MKLCKRCIDAIHSHGENVWVGPMLEREMDVDDEGKWFTSDGLTCEWCEEEVEDLYDCHFQKGAGAWKRNIEKYVIAARETLQI